MFTRGGLIQVRFLDINRALDGNRPTETWRWRWNWFGAQSLCRRSWNNKISWWL